MELSFDHFYRMNRRILIWAALFGLIWLLRDFFGIIFMVFVLSFITAPLSKALSRYLRLPKRLAITVVYVCLLLAFVSFLRFVTPQVVREANVLIGNVGQLETSLIDYRQELVKRYPSMHMVLMDYVRGNIPPDDLEELKAREEPTDDGLIRLFFESKIRELRQKAPEYVGHLWKSSATMALALLFSFLISMDTARLRKELAGLSVSRLQDFYEQTAQPVVRFGYVVGQALQAQAIIACVNTLLTLIGLLLLGIPNLALLCLIVFLFSFIPVLGVFISTSPIVLVAINTGGIGKAIAVILLVTGIHLVEAYILNPLIYGRHLKLNPVLGLMILFVGHHAFGLWGMLLGVPVAYYLIHDVLGVPLWDQERLKKTGLSGQSQPPPEQPPA